MEQERNPATDPDGEELLSYDHVDAGFEADQDPEFGAFEGPEAGDDRSRYAEFLRHTVESGRVAANLSAAILHASGCCKLG